LSSFLALRFIPTVFVPEMSLIPTSPTMSEKTTCMQTKSAITTQHYETWERAKKEGVET